MMKVKRVLISGLATATLLVGGTAPSMASDEVDSSVNPTVTPTSAEIAPVLESRTSDGEAPAPSATKLDPLDSSTTAAAAATSCGSRTVPAEYGITVFGNYYKSVVHTSGLTNCRKNSNITSASVSSHSCNKNGWWTIANSITKSRQLGATGVPQSTSLFECNFHGGAQIKGVGIGITRDLYTRITAYVQNSVLWHKWSIWDSCC